MYKPAASQHSFIVLLRREGSARFFKKNDGLREDFPTEPCTDQRIVSAPFITSPCQSVEASTGHSAHIQQDRVGVLARGRDTSYSSPPSVFLPLLVFLYLPRYLHLRSPS
jgi:hypothetical protein